MSDCYTKRSLTEKDKKELKYQCRTGKVLSFLSPPAIFVILVFGISFFISEPSLIEYSIIAIVAICIGLFIGYTMTNKYLKDILNDEKELYIKTIDKKEKHLDFDAGGGKSSCLLKEKEAFTSYYFVIENTKYKVRKELYEQCQEGDEVFFAIAPLSRYRLEILPRIE